MKYLITIDPIPDSETDYLFTVGANGNMIEATTAPLMTGLERVKSAIAVDYLEVR